MIVRDESGVASWAPNRLGSIRTRLTLLYSILLFGLAAIVVGGIYLSLSRALSDEPLSRDTRYGDLIAAVESASGVSGDDALPVSDRLVAFEGEVNRRALDQLRTYSVTALVALFLGSLAVGWYVAGLVLRPIGRISSVAREISATDLSRRIDLGGPDDELRDLADTFDDMLGRLDVAFESQRRFVQEASHELRNPLAVLRANLDVVMADPDADTDDFRAAGEVAGRAASRMSALVDDLLLYAHHERTDSRREPVDAAIVVAETVEDFGATAAAAGIVLLHEIAPELPVVGDPVALRRALANLLSNAIRVSDPTCRVRVTAGQDAEMVWMSVLDDGPGLSPEDQERVFQRFWRGDRASAREAGRSGLGLAIVRQIAEAHGGQVTLRSTIGVGSTFTVWLPRFVDS
ncbi:MAG: HAMP domain-containing histidine kinase [Acidimicrobiia bacterium]|nr:HAMP domain-containing histidine kinase [Actinomycetota bacterium]MBL6923869.1 HAMP domain-containing histidine kinase [Acidimicrobiia bacterium]MBL6926360.1 HAMP domain-containing histidine kinase [Acidimicrobiia bacterium]